jgi:citrate synthase
MHDSGWSPQDTAQKLLAWLKESGKRMPGFGHRIHTKDPRTQRLYELAEQHGYARDHVTLSRHIEGEFAKKKALPINVDGAIAAILSDMGFDHRLGKAFFVLGRCAGLIAHVYEEMTTQKPMRKMCSQDTEYDGPWERDLDKGKR